MSPASPAPKPTSPRIPDVRALLASLKTRQAKTEADRSLAQRLWVAFERMASVEVQGLHFYVYEGAVTIYGALPTETERQTVLDTIAAIPGVARITDHLDVVAS